MNTMSHKGYTARVQFDERDSILVGRILGVRSIISFHGETVAQLRAEFEAAVDDYIRECRELGLEPERPASGKLLLRVPPDVHGKALVVAQAAGKSLNQWATEVLQNAVQAARPKADAYEREVLHAFENATLKSVATKSKLARLKAAARSTAGARSRSARAR